MKIGDRVVLLKPHPHAGEHGEFVRVEECLFGLCPIVRMDDCATGEEECFVIYPTQGRKEE